MKTLLLLSLLPVLLFGNPVPHGYKPGPLWPTVSTPVYRATSLPDLLGRHLHWIGAGFTVQGYRDTHSMRPVLHGGHEKLAVVPCVPGTVLSAGQLVIFDRGDLPSVLHYIAAISRDGQSVYLSGVGNRKSDGWFDRSSVRLVVLEILVAPENLR